MEQPRLEKMAMSSLVGGTLSSLQLAEASSQALLHRGPLCEAEQPRGVLCDSFPVISLQEVLPFFRANFDIFAGLTSGAFWSRSGGGRAGQRSLILYLQSY